MEPSVEGVEVSMDALPRTLLGAVEVRTRALRGAAVATVLQHNTYVAEPFYLVPCDLTLTECLRWVVGYGWAEAASEFI